MQIAILSWGSLVWDPGDLHIVNGEWHRGGPELPIELSRLSDGRRHLTYVIDPRHRRRVPTRYALSELSDLETAIGDLALREGCNDDLIGYVEASSTGRHRARAGVPWEDVRTWTQRKKLDAVIWTDLPPKFPTEWTLDAAVKFWRGMPAETQERARTYAANAPVEIDTDLRRRLTVDGLI